MRTWRITTIRRLSNRKRLLSANWHLLNRKHEQTKKILRFLRILRETSIRRRRNNILWETQMRLSAAQPILLNQKSSSVSCEWWPSANWHLLNRKGEQTKKILRFLRILRETPIRRRRTNILWETCMRLSAAQPIDSQLQYDRSVFSNKKANPLIYLHLTRFRPSKNHSCF